LRGFRLSMSTPMRRSGRSRRPEGVSGCDLAEGTNLDEFRERGLRGAVLFLRQEQDFTSGKNVSFARDPHRGLSQRGPHCRKCETVPTRMVLGKEFCGCFHRTPHPRCVRIQVCVDRSQFIGVLRPVDPQNGSAGFPSGMRVHPARWLLD
jgi:hypothetical protein